MTYKEAVQLAEMEFDWSWETFRREAAKDILCAIITSDTAGTYDEKCELAITISDELVRKLKEDKK